MKKILLTALLLMFFVAPLFGVSFTALGQGPPGEPPADIDIMDVLQRIVSWLFSILLVVAAIFIIVAAYMFVTAGGEPEKVATARRFVLYALIGVAVAVASRGLVAFVERIVAG